MIWWGQFDLLLVVDKKTSRPFDLLLADEREEPTADWWLCTAEVHARTQHGFLPALPFVEIQS